MTSTTFNCILENVESSRLLRTTEELPVFVPSARSSRRIRVSWKLALWVSAAITTVPVMALAQPWKWWQSPVSAIEHSESPPRLLSIAHPTPAKSTLVRLPATIRPWQFATLNARVSGYLKNWRVDLGARVEAGDLLAEIETPELDQELTQGIALIREADAAVEQAKAERNEAEADVKAGEAELGRANAEAELARSQAVRREKLVVTRAVSLEEFDTFAKQVETRYAEVTAAESELARRRANLATRSAVIEARQATVNSRQANVDRLKELQSFQRIVAPFAGASTRRDAEVGMLITAGKESLFTIEDMSRVRVQVNVPQTYATVTKVGAAATVGLPEVVEAANAVVTRTADAVDPTTRTMLAEIELDNLDGRWQPGSYAQVGLATAAAGSAWTIPTNTLQMQVDGPHVAIVDERNRIEVRPVKLGRDLGDRIVIASGIDGRERIVVNPSDDLISGTKVKIRERENELAQR